MFEINIPVIKKFRVVENSRDDPGTVVRRVRVTASYQQCDLRPDSRQQRSVLHDQNQVTNTLVCTNKRSVLIIKPPAGKMKKPIL